MVGDDIGRGNGDGCSGAWGNVEGFAGGASMASLLKWATAPS